MLDAVGVVGKPGGEIESCPLATRLHSSGRQKHPTATGMAAQAVDPSEGGISVAVREFRDSNGRDWRAWEVTPDAINPRTKEEDFLADLYYTGWIVFETKSEADKRRLYPVPKKWDELPDPELEILLNKAERVPKRKMAAEKRESGAQAAASMDRTANLIEQATDGRTSSKRIASEANPDVTDLGVLRSFRYPGGRIWAVCLAQSGEDGAPVLRFSAGTRIIELEDWPKDWPDLPDEGLAELLRRAAPRAAHDEPAADAPHRRYTDPQAEA